MTLELVNAWEEISSIVVKDRRHPVERAQPLPTTDEAPLLAFANSRGCRITPADSRQHRQTPPPLRFLYGSPKQQIDRMTTDTIQAGPRQAGPRTPPLATYPTTYQITGFDRLSFVGDVANAIPQDEYCHITGLAFEADGVRVNGRLIVQVADESHRRLIDRQLRSVRGLVSITQTN
ncbi:MAG: hypothetical protein H7Z72_05890 [Bacteroidetes bacterium]|nr:hypothetical protein [Fibrella sp.]